MSKLHTAILTTDPFSNLYVCGVGRGGRLGLGDFNTQFRFVPVQGALANKRVEQVALGQNHTMAIAGNGELWTWGLNVDSQLGYALPPPLRTDEEPMSSIPRQVFGTLKNQAVYGIAASAVHSVAHTRTSLYCWGRNLGQLALMDADSRSLDVQQTPRKVAASLLTAPIEMVSAIDKATTCLLSNFTVWVFTSYGYNLVKFPVVDPFSNYNLATSFNPFDPKRRNIRYIASGGDVIAAINVCGDLFTMSITSQPDGTQSATSTTNPAKIKGAVTIPQCIWDSRKDGVTSVDVSEHGSVIICTESGAVWRRMKRTKRKTAAFATSADVKRSDFKFERVPYVTNGCSVRSSTFGAFAIMRQDNKVMTEQVSISRQSVWADVSSLLCLKDFPAFQESASDTRYLDFEDSASVKMLAASICEAVLQSSDIERDLLRWLGFKSSRNAEAKLLIRTTSNPDLCFPVHEWALAGRSSVLRKCFSEHRLQDTSIMADNYELELIDGRRIFTLIGADLLTVVNMLLYSYTDQCLPVWKFTRRAPQLAHRFRQVRSEVMKLATRFDMPQLEAAARLQNDTELSLDKDLLKAMLDPKFFDSADLLVQLDGHQVTLHSELICKRCPFFEGMFFGRSQGQWVASRRSAQDSTEMISIDLGHVSLQTFNYVKAFLYADTGSAMFDSVVVPSIDEFSEIVLDVMGVANELMLDRLSEICQATFGKLVTTRNIAQLLNEISPCSVTSFKDAGLEYLCLQLEMMLENHLLDGLDEDLLHDLDLVVRDNQLARLPYARSGRAELLLHEADSNLISDIDEERQRRVREMAFKSYHREEDKRLAYSSKARLNSFEETVGFLTPDRHRCRSKSEQGDHSSPSLKQQASLGDLMFAMEDEATAGTRSSPRQSAPKMARRLGYDVEDVLGSPTSLGSAKGKEITQRSESLGFESAPIESSPTSQFEDVQTPPTGPARVESDSPWAAFEKVPVAKLDIGGSLAHRSTQSNLTANLSRQDSKPVAALNIPAKLSQKERKKLAQNQASSKAEEESKTDQPRQSGSTSPSATRSKPAPWGTPTNVPKLSLRDAISAENLLKSADPIPNTPVIATQRQASTPKRTASPDTRFPGQGRVQSSPAIPTASSKTTKQPLVPHSKSYMKPSSRPEVLAGSSMTDIIGQQRREQDLVKEAAAKRSLQEIQQEQEFQEWWNQESQRAQEEEARRQNTSTKKESKGNRGPRKSKEKKLKSVAEAGQPATARDTAGGGSQARKTEGRRGRPATDVRSKDMDKGSGRRPRRGGGSSGEKKE